MSARPSERAAALVLRWVRFYTRRLPADVAARRVDEVAADLHDHIAHETALGTPDGRTALGVLSRCARGVAADAAWRGRNRSRRRHSMKLYAAALAVIALGVAAMIFGEGDDSPGLQLIGFLLIAGAFLVAWRRTVRRRRSADGG
ncbi:hypothetical protein [Actinoplanes sp. URMC 104]|uniref:hypothetical protein n=1 Tax=Actinoplanes sp. URMC 104 TaxID=3423409 RepID=UPI003F1B8327